MSVSGPRAAIGVELMGQPQVLSRRTKSNPVVSFKSVALLDPWTRVDPLISQLIGPPGVGKTAVLEGLASRIVAKEVPEVCHKVDVLNLFASPLTPRNIKFPVPPTQARSINRLGCDNGRLRH